MAYLIFLLAILLIIYLCIFSAHLSKRLRLLPGNLNLEGRIGKTVWGYVIRTPSEPELSCRMIKKIRDIPFPVHSFTALPKLPLKECDLVKCRCVYQEMNERRMIDERRGGGDRRNIVRLDLASDRRSRKNRRKG